MSLILEALRKSEAERRRGQTPDVAAELSPPPAPARIDLARWMWPVLGLVALLAALPVLAIWWTTRTPATPAPRAAPAVATEIQPAAAPAVVPRRPQPVPKLAPAAPAPLPSPAPARVPPVAVATPEPAPASAPPPAPTPPAPPAAVGLPGVRLSMHLWNDDPARRFVVLNGQRMMEGERNGDLLLVEILRDGVLVERNGQRARIDLP